MPTTFAKTIDGNDIFAKRAECDAAGNDLSTTYATKNELPNGVPSVTSSDDGKVLKASYTGGTGSFSWETESGGTVTDVEVDGTSVVSGGVASITMPTELVPTVTSNDDGKVLKATYSGGAGSYSWETESGGTQVQSSWTESDSSAPSYIQNKPVPKTLVAGTGITITESSTELTVASTNQRYNAGTGLTLNNATFAVDTSVIATTAGVASDISSAVGALPTNLTSAQIQALKEALGVDETVLYSGVKTNSNDGSATYTLSELPTNFQYIEVQYSANDNSFPAAINVNCGVGSVRWDTTVYQAYNTTVWLLMNGSGDLTTLTNYTISANFHNIRTTTWSVQGFLNAATTNAKWFHINKIIGIHRIASN